MFDQINRLIVSVVTVILVGIATLLPANAEEINSNGNNLVALGSSSSLQISPTFDPEKVRLGITPTGWSNSDDLTIDLNPPIPYQQILDEMELTGFKGTQNAPKFPKDINVLIDELDQRDLTISEPWVGTYFTIGAAKDSQKIFEDQMAFMKKIGGSNSIVVAELGCAVHQQPIDPLVNRPKFTDEQWQKLFDGLNSIGKQATEAGMVLSYHPHVGTGVETLEDIDRLMAGTDPRYVHLLLDTGHLYYVGTDPLEVTEKYADRIKHVHLKNIRENELDISKDTGRSFLDSIRAGIFTVPGDQEGIIKFEPILQTLAKANYEGWLMVEAEQDPNNAEPLLYAQKARKYLSAVTGL